MFWSKSRARAFFFSGAMLAFIGLGLYLWDLRLEGAIVTCLGISLMVVGMSVLRFMFLLDMKGVKIRDGGQDR